MKEILQWLILIEIIYSVNFKLKIMTPNTKAWELIDDFYRLVEFDLDKDKQIQNAKKCALVTVNEILKAQPTDRKYWECVLIELNKL